MQHRADELVEVGAGTECIAAASEHHGERFRILVGAIDRDFEFLQQLRADAVAFVRAVEPDGRNPIVCDLVLNDILFQHLSAPIDFS